MYQFVCIFVCLSVCLSVYLSTVSIFSEAYAVACLGVTGTDWEVLAAEALEVGKLSCPKTELWKRACSC